MFEDLSSTEIQLFQSFKAQFLSSFGETKYRIKHSISRNVFLYLHHDRVEQSHLGHIDYSIETKCKICTTSPRYSSQDSDSDTSPEITNTNSSRGPGKRLIQAPVMQESESIKKMEKKYRADAVYYFKRERAVTFFEAKSERLTSVSQITKSLWQCVCYAVTELTENDKDPCMMLLLWKDFISLVDLYPVGKDFTYKISNFEFCEGNEEILKVFWVTYRKRLSVLTD